MRRFLGLVVAVLVGLSLVVTPNIAGATDALYMDANRKYKLATPEVFPPVESQYIHTVDGTRATWNVTYQDVVTNSNIGFDDAANGATRRATLDAVLQYIDDQIVEHASGAVDINVAVSETDGGGFLAAAGPTFWCTDGCTNGWVFLHLTTGADQDPTTPDMTVTVDFGYSWNDDMGAPAGGEYDLFSVLLHEFTHGLGLASLSLSDGGSEATAGCTNNAVVYFIFDDFTRRVSSNNDLWDCSPVGYSGTAADLISDDLDWTGPQCNTAYGSNPPIYAPGAWADGSSLAHWDPSAAANSLMQPSISPGTQRRSYLPWERSALEDLGYTTIPVGLMSFTVE